MCLLSQRNLTMTLINTIPEVNPCFPAHHGAKSNDEIVAAMLPGTCTRTDLPVFLSFRLYTERLDMDKAEECLFVRGSNDRLNSLTTALGQETDRFDNLLQVVRVTHIAHKKICIQRLLQK